MNDHYLKQTQRLWYNTPAEQWTEALPVGNGRLGAMVYGGVNRDTIKLNEDSIWGGNKIDRHNPQALSTLPEIRKLLFADKNKEASELAEKTMVSIPNEPFSYQPLGDLTICFSRSSEYRDYRREIRLDQAIASVDFAMNDVDFHKEYFVSAPDQVIVVRYSCKGKNRISLHASLTRQEDAHSVRIADDMIMLKGQGGQGGIQFAALLKVIAINGTVQAGVQRKDGEFVCIEEADSVIFYIAAHTSYRDENPGQKCLDTIAAACKKEYEQIKTDHIRDYQRLYNRFELDLSNGREDQVGVQDTTYERYLNIRKGIEDPRFYVLYLNYNRYLLISSSRPGCLPSNLQGIWNDKMQAPWESDFHTNVNFQINYWGAEGYNLAECHLPVFDWLRETIIPNGEETAKRIYGCRGWVLHHCTDIWGSASPIYSLLGIWPMGGAWVCRHLYEHYLYTLDSDFLRDTAYPIIRESVRFMLDFLVEAPAGTPCAGSLVTVPSHSPENRFIDENGYQSWFTYASTMDMEIISDHFTYCIKVIEILGKDNSTFDWAFKNEIKEALSKLPPLKISKKHGGIQEWIKDYDEFEPGHRHVSHLFACYPANQISVTKTPELAEAVKKTLIRRLSSNYDGQGWCLGWIANIWARLRQGEEAYAILQTIAKNFLLYNLFIEAHGNPQVGDAQAVPSAILEMLVQSQDECIVLLPALPQAWPDGFIKGMRLRGGSELDLCWKDGMVTQAHIKTVNGAKPMPVKGYNAALYDMTETDAETTIKLKRLQI